MESQLRAYILERLVTWVVGSFVVKVAYLYSGGWEVKGVDTWAPRHAKYAIGSRKLSCPHMVM